MPTRERVQSLITMVEANRFIEAIEEFYTADATMQENGEPARRGRETLILGERMMLKAVRSISTMPVHSWTVDGDQVVINWTFEFVHHDGSRALLDELAYQHWRGDRIAAERFYYDPAQRVARI